MPEELTIRFELPGEPPNEIASAWLIDESNAQYVAGLVKLDDYTASLDLETVASGRYWLSAHISNHPVLRFTIDINGAAERTVRFVGYSPRCATITTQCATAGVDTSRRVHAINFALPARHSAIVLIAGFDHRAQQGTPTDYTAFARQWRNDLYHGVSDAGGIQNQKIDREIFEHSVVTTFNFATGDVCEQIRGDGGWHTMYPWMCGAERPYTLNPNTQESADIRSATDSISITDVYRYISELGRHAPGCLSNLHFFSHAFPGAPILLNTTDPAKLSSPVRNPGDKDPRSKDLNRENREKHWPHLRDAFAPDSRLKSWGCFGEDYLLPRIKRVLHTKTRTEQVEYEGQMISSETVMVDVADALCDSYLMACVKVLGVDAWGAAPSTTCVYKRGYMYVDQSDFGSIIRWFEKCYGGRRDITGHFPYRQFVRPEGSEP